MLKKAPTSAPVTPGAIILNTLVKEMKAAGIDYISLKDLEKVLSKS